MKFYIREYILVILWYTYCIIEYILFNKVIYYFIIDIYVYITINLISLIFKFTF